MPGIAVRGTRGGGPASLRNTQTASLQTTPGLSSPATTQVLNLPSSYCRGYLLGQGLILALTACVTHEVKLCHHLCPLLSRPYLSTKLGKVDLGRKTGKLSQFFFISSSSLDMLKLLRYELTQFITYMRISIGKRRNKRMADYSLSKNV